MDTLNGTSGLGGVVAGGSSPVGSGQIGGSVGEAVPDRGDTPEPVRTPEEKFHAAEKAFVAAAEALLASWNGKSRGGGVRVEVERLEALRDAQGACQSAAYAWLRANR